MTADATLRPATDADLEAVAELWHRGWHDGHTGHVPEGLTAARTRAAFGARVPALLPATTVAEVAGGRGLVPNPDISVPEAAVRDHSAHRREVVGFVVVIHDEVEQLFVAAPHRGSEVAGLLLAEAERQIAGQVAGQVAGQGYDEAWLAVVTGNTRARRFYERRGWRDGGELPYEVDAGGTTYVSPCRRYLKRVR